MVAKRQCWPLGFRKLLVHLGENQDEKFIPNHFPQISWLLIIYAQNPCYLYASRLIAGVVGAGQLICITIFVTEISHDKYALIGIFGSAESALIIVTSIPILNVVIS